MTTAKTVKTNTTPTEMMEKLPETITEVTEKSAEQAKAAFDKANNMANENVKVFDEAATAWKEGATTFQAKAFEIAQANMNAQFEFTRKLFAAKDARQAYDIHEAFLREQIKTFANQAKDLSDLSIALSEKISKPVQDGVLKSYEEMRKSFAA